MAVLFHPLIPVDHLHWLPILKDTLRDFDFRVWPDTGDTAEIDYIIAWKLFPDDATNWPNLKAVLSLSAGVNQYIGHKDWPKHAALIRMIEPGLTQGMVEYITSFTLRFHTRHDHMKEIAKSPWGSVIPKLARDRTVGIMGLGEMGLACAKSLKNLGFNVRGWTRTKKDIPGLTNFYGHDQLDNFLKETEILICLLPLTSSTQGILNRETLSKLPQGACLINAARGQHLIEEDLLVLLKNGHIDQVALDVFRQEPLPADHPFQAHPRIHITPHLAAITQPYTGALSIKHAIQQLERGERPDGWVDINRGY